jgi:hypothetical protein
MTQDQIKKALQRHKAHLDTEAFETLCEDPYILLEEIASVRKVRGGAVRVSLKDGDALWYYRGVEISLHPEVSAGYWGRWTTGGYRHGSGFESLAEAVKHIESHHPMPLESK